jgi:hypothetical protein
MKIFSKFKKTNDYSNYLEKIVEYFENTIRCIRKCKKHFFDKKCLTLSKKNKKVHLKIFDSVDQNPQ